jgi:hypothetical protein
MESGTNGTGDEGCSVCVAVKIRPLVPAEIDQGCRLCMSVTPGLPKVKGWDATISLFRLHAPILCSNIITQVSTGHHEFTYDHVFGGDGAHPETLYSKCVAPLVDGLFRGYNATIFAYGQTGSGKSYTMGSEYRPGGKAHGVIPEAISAIFTRISVIPSLRFIR